MAKLRKRGNYTTIKEAILANSGCSEEELLNPVMEDPRAINNLYNAAAYVIRAIQQHLSVTVIGDYDSDGLNATAILVKMFRHYGVEPKTIIPRRISDGYGLSEGLLEDIPVGLVITIDNGIGAVEEIAALKKKGCIVLVMDHHLPGKKLPPADLIVDPHVEPKKNGFLHYCGAGLGYQLARLVLEQDHSAGVQALLWELNVHAAIATITDVMPLIGPNRRIVMDGIYHMNFRTAEMSAAMQVLLSLADGKTINEDTLGFVFGPILNAPARLYDAGGTSVLNALVSVDPMYASQCMAKMVEINNQRKALVNRITADVLSQVEKENLLSRGAPLVVYTPGVPEGLLGIVAGKLAETYKMPAFMFSDSKQDPEMVKGSGRAGENGNLEPLLEPLMPVCVACGGHTGAMGITVRRDMYPEMDRIMREVLARTPAGDQDLVLVDVCLDPAQIPQAFREMQSFAPFGEGVKKPVILIRNFTATPKYGSHFKIMGADNSVLKVFGKDFDLLGFKLASKYTQASFPGIMDAVGVLGENSFNGRTSIQFEMIDFSPRG